MNYSPHVILLTLIETVLIVSTYFFLSAPRERPVLQWAGVLMMGITFCWSVIFGCVLAINSLTLSI
jgi:hypothetical protein